MFFCDVTTKQSQGPTQLHLQPLKDLVSLSAYPKIQSLIKLGHLENNRPIRREAQSNLSSDWLPGSNAEGKYKIWDFETIILYYAQLIDPS